MKKNIIFLLIVVLQLYVLIPTQCYAKHKYLEKEYQNFWAEQNNAIAIEYVLPDRARVDIITKEYAIEVDFASKWAEAVGQSLYYAEMTKLKPGILLILENIKEYKFVFRIRVLTEKYGIKLFLIMQDDIDVSVIDK